MAHPVAKITRLGMEGYGVRRASSFAGKTPSSGITQTVTPKVWALRGGYGRQALQGNKGYSK